MKAESVPAAEVAQEETAAEVVAEEVEEVILIFSSSYSSISSSTALILIVIHINVLLIFYRCYRSSRLPPRNDRLTVTTLRPETV